MTVTLIGILLFALSFYLRIRPRIKQADFGIDSWYYLLYIGELRKTKRLPIKLPYFLLDIDEQWYPAGLPLILTFFTQRFLERCHWAISAFIDSLHLLLLYSCGYFLSNNVAIASAAAFFYATSPILITHSSSLNSRPLGAVVLSLQMVFLYQYIVSFSLLYLVLVVISGAALLNTHKLATQQLVILYVGFSLIYWNLSFACILAAIFVVAFLLSGGFYRKVMMSHIQILKFWKKNLPFLFAHQVYQSPLYTNQDKAITKRGTKGIASRKLWFLLAKIQFVLIFSAVALYALNNKKNLISQDVFLLNWLLLNFITIATITYLPLIKFFGEGQRYFMYGIFPCALLLAKFIFLRDIDLYIRALFLLAIVAINLLLIYKIHSDQKANMLAVIDPDFSRILNYIKQLPRDNIMCLPYAHCEAIAYFCRKKTLWGAHSYLDEKIESFFPVLLKPVEYFISFYKLSYCLVNKDFVSLDDLHINIKYKIILEEGRYVLLEF